MLTLGIFPETSDTLPRLGALNLYATRPDVFSTEDRLMAMLLAAHGAVALASATRLDQAHLESEQLRDGMLSRDVIGQAKGVLMERQRCRHPRASRRWRATARSLSVGRRPASRACSTASGAARRLT